MASSIAARFTNFGVRSLAAASLACSLAACSGSSGDPSEPDVFDPPPPPEGFTRIAAPIIKNLQPGSNSTVCQYVFAPFDRDMDVLEVQGYQSKYGHHAIAYAMNVDVPIGTTRDCNTEDNVQIGAFLGGVGGDAGGAVDLPEGIAFRMPKGSSIMLNTHFVNTGHEVVDGESILDMKFAEVDLSRSVASMFVNVGIGFQVEPGVKSTTDVTCTMPRDLEFIMFTNHMHDLGVSAITEVIRPGSNPELTHEDPNWAYEMQFNPEFTRWSPAEPFLVKQGDALRTHCEWNNPGGDVVTFPDEMCVGIGFYLTTKNSAPRCINGHWMESSN